MLQITEARDDALQLGNQPLVRRGRTAAKEKANIPAFVLHLPSPEAIVRLVCGEQTQLRMLNLPNGLALSEVVMGDAIDNATNAEHEHNNRGQKHSRKDDNNDDVRIHEACSDTE